MFIVIIGAYLVAAENHYSPVKRVCLISVDQYVTPSQLDVS